MKYFLPGNSYCGSNCLSKLITPAFSTVYIGSTSLPIQYVVMVSVSLFHFLLCCLYFCATSRLQDRRLYCLIIFGGIILGVQSVLKNYNCFLVVALVGKR